MTKLKWYKTITGLYRSQRPGKKYIMELSNCWVHWCLTSHATIFQSYMWRHWCAGRWKTLTNFSLILHIYHKSYWYMYTFLNNFLNLHLNTLHVLLIYKSSMVFGILYLLDLLRDIFCISVTICMHFYFWYKQTIILLQILLRLQLLIYSTEVSDQLKGTWTWLGPMFVYKNYFTRNSYRIITESHPKMYKPFWKGLNNKQSWNHS